MNASTPSVQAVEAPLWHPSPERVARARITAYRRDVERTLGLSLPDSTALWQWSIANLGPFWDSIWRYFDGWHPRRWPGARESDDAWRHLVPGRHPQLRRPGAKARPVGITGNHCRK